MDEDKKRVCIFCQHLIDKPPPTTCPSCNSQLRDKSYLVAPKGPLSEPLLSSPTVRQILPNIASQKQATEKVPAAKRTTAQPPPLPPDARKQASVQNQPTLKHPGHRPGTPVESEGIHDAETEIGALASEKTNQWLAAETVLGSALDKLPSPSSEETIISDLDDAEETRLDLGDDAEETFKDEATLLHPVSAAETEAVSAAATRALLDDVATRLGEGNQPDEEEKEKGFHVAGTKLLDVDSEENTDPKKPSPDGFHAASTKLFDDKE